MNATRTQFLTFFALIISASAGADGSWTYEARPSGAASRFVAEGGDKLKHVPFHTCRLVSPQGTLMSEPVEAEQCVPKAERHYLTSTPHPSQAKNFVSCALKDAQGRYYESSRREECFPEREVTRHVQVSLGEQGACVHSHAGREILPRAALESCGVERGKRFEFITSGDASLGCFQYDTQDRPLWRVPVERCFRNEQLEFSFIAGDRFGASYCQVKVKGRAHKELAEKDDSCKEFAGYERKLGINGVNRCEPQYRAGNKTLSPTERREASVDPEACTTLTDRLTIIGDGDDGICAQLDTQGLPFRAVPPENCKRQDQLKDRV